MHSTHSYSHTCSNEANFYSVSRDCCYCCVAVAVIAAAAGRKCVCNYGIAEGINTGFFFGTKGNMAERGYSSYD